MGRHLAVDRLAHQAQRLGIDLAVHEHGDPIGEMVEEAEHAFLLGGVELLGAKQRQELALGLGAEKQRAPDHRVAALESPGEQRIGRRLEPRAEDRRQRPAQAKVLDDHDVAARRKVASHSVQHPPQAGEHAALAQEPDRLAEQAPAPVERQRRGHVQAQPGCEPVERARRRGRRREQPERARDLVLERRQHAFEQGQIALEEVERAWRSSSLAPPAATGLR